MKEAEDPILRIIGANVYWFRTRMEISQEDLGFRADMHRNYVGEIERAEAEPSVVAISRLSKPLGVLPFELLVERPDVMKAWEIARKENARPRKVATSKRKHDTKK